jgi:hypothetical protein
MSKKLTLKAKLSTHRSKFYTEPHETIEAGIRRLEDFGLTPANMHPRSTLSDRGRSTLRYPVAEIWSRRQKLDFLRRSGLLPAALEMERRAFRKALHIKKMEKPRDRDFAYIQREKNRNKGDSPPRVLGEDNARLIEQMRIIRTRPVSVFRLRPVHSNEDLMPTHISQRELKTNKSIIIQATDKLNHLQSKCSLEMSPVKSKDEKSEFGRQLNPIKQRLHRYLKQRIMRLTESLNK